MILDNSHLGRIRRAADELLCVQADLRQSLRSGLLTSEEHQKKRDMSLTVAGLVDALRGLQKLLGGDHGA